MISINLYAQNIELSPFVDRGPFFPINPDLPMDNDLTVVKNSTSDPEGEVIEIRGTIKNKSGEPISNADVMIWQTDNNGNYDHPFAAMMMGKEKVELDKNFQYWGKTISDSNGNYFFKTIVPKPYIINDLERPAHVHFRVKHDDYKILTMELHFPNDKYLKDDPVTQHLDEDDHEQLMAKITIPPDGYGSKIAAFNIVLQKEK